MWECILGVALLSTAIVKQPGLALTGASAYVVSLWWSTGREGWRVFTPVEQREREGYVPMRPSHRIICSSDTRVVDLPNESGAAAAADFDISAIISSCRGNMAL